MLTWAIAFMFQRAKAMPGLYFIGALCGDCYIAAMAAYAITGKLPW